MEYKLKVINDLCFASIDGDLYLIDTGSPYTFSFKKTVEIDGKMIKNKGFKKILTKRLLALSNKYDINVVGIVGLDLISMTGLTINRKDKKVLFGISNIAPKEEYSFMIKEIKKQKYIVLNNLSLKGFSNLGKVPMALDTGVKENQLDIMLAGTSQYGWKVEYYYPSLAYDFSFDLRFFDILEDKSKRSLMVAEVSDQTILKQFDFVGVKGTLSFNDLKDETFIIDVHKNKIYIA